PSLLHGRRETRCIASAGALRSGSRRNSAHETKYPPATPFSPGVLLMQRLFRAAVAAAAIGLFASPPTPADARPHALFRRGPALPLGTPAPGWGMAAPGEGVALSVYKDGKQVGLAASTTADAEGHWRLDLPAFKEPGGPYELQFTGNKNKLTVKDVLVGEV